MPDTSKPWELFSQKKPWELFGASQSALAPAIAPVNPDSITLDPYQAAELHALTAGRGKPETGMESGTEFTQAVFNQLPQDVANVARAIPADIAAKVADYPEAGGNIKAALGREPLPIDAAIREAAKESKGAATIAHLSQDLAGTLPMLAVLKSAPPEMAKSLLYGFTGKMVADAPEVASQLKSELSKPKIDQDADKISSLIAQAIQITGFTALAAKPAIADVRNAIQTKAQGAEPAIGTPSIDQPGIQLQASLEGGQEAPQINEPITQTQTAPSQTARETVKPVTETGIAATPEPVPTETPAATGGQVGETTAEITPQAIAENWLVEQNNKARNTGLGKSSPDAALKVVSEWIRKGETPDGPIPKDIQDALMRSLGPTKDLETGEVLDQSSGDWPRTGTLIDFLEKQSQERIPSSLENLPKSPIPAEKETAGVQAGIVVPGTSAIQAVIARAKDAISELRDLSGMSPFRESLLKWSAEYQRSHQEIYNTARELRKAVPNSLRRTAIANWIEAAGDVKELANRASSTSNPRLKQGYLEATKLTPEEVTVAQRVKQVYDDLLKRGQNYGVLDSFRDNYVTHLWDRGGALSSVFGGRKLSQNFKYAQKRTFESFFEGEQAGLKPHTKDIARLLPIYMEQMNKVIADRQFVERMSKGVAEDGRPLVAPKGSAQRIDDPSGQPQVYLQFPKTAKEGFEDYKELDQPALRKWMWRGADENGAPIMVKSDLAAHPSVAAHLKNVLGKSAIREWWDTPGGAISGTIKQGTKFAFDTVQPLAKELMLGVLSPFHIVQEGTHGVFHRVNPFAVTKIDLVKNPEHMDAAEHGLMLQPDRVSMSEFKEGLGGTRFLGQIKGIGPIIDGFNHWTFERYIPGLKYDTYVKMLGRNMDRYKGDLASGKVTESQVKNETARQANAAYGHLNYAELGRNPTLRHFFQIAALAPDFFEARGRFVGQAGKGLISKSGAEQLQALAFGAALFWVTARIGNKISEDDWHFDHPFSIVHGSREFRMRSVPEDIYRLFHDWRMFASGRLSPLIGRPAMELLSGRNYRGEKVTVPEVAQDMAMSFVPIWAQHIPGLKELSRTTAQNPVSAWESFFSASGLHVSRYSPITITYQNAHKWLEAQGKPMERGTYPVSKYQQLRYALEDGDFEKARDEKQKLIDSGLVKPGKLAAGFKESIYHPFTDSKADDDKFRKSLSEKDRLLFDAAKQRRDLIWRRFNAIPQK